MKVSHIALSAALLASGTYGFVTQHASESIRNAPKQLFLEPSALTEYMAKAHGDKLKAVQQMEAQKNEEIKVLRQELQQVQQQAPSSAITPVISGNVADMSKDEMAQKLIAYQQFMSKYIVEAQQQKAKAVLAAENALKQKYEEKLVLVGGTKEEAKPAPVKAKPAQVSAETKLYQERSGKVTAAAKAGKSRWGDMENQRAAQAATTVAAPVAPVAPVEETKIEVATVGDTSLYNKRVAMVAAAGKAGKSRWGDMEVQRATTVAASLPASPVSDVTAPAKGSVAAAVEIVPPEVEAADHGLRNDGGVGGPSLAERINLGAQLLNQGSSPVADVLAPSSTAPVVVSSAPILSLFERRNLMVAAAGRAGKARWGDFEVQKAQSIAAALPSGAVAAPAVVAVATPPEVEAADHGLRNDGGVGGPSLADRVNLGASLLGQ